jgi:hypothetical protein
MLTIKIGHSLRQLLKRSFLLSIFLASTPGIVADLFADTLETAPSSENAQVTATLPKAEYPRMLLGDDLIAHFSSFPRVEANHESTGFTLSISQGIAKRSCPSCKLTQDNGKVRFKPNQNQVCIEWGKATYPPSGCFNLVQTNSSNFELRTLAGKTVISYAISAPSRTIVADSKVATAVSTTGSDLSRPIFFNVSMYQIGNQVLQDAGKQAFLRRGWIIDPCENECLRGRLEKGGELHRAEMRFHYPYIEIGFIPGFDQGKSSWLDYLKKDILVYLNGARAAQ